MTQKTPAIRIENLNYTYVDEWTRRKKKALKNVSLEVISGECFGFLGHNGAGKTTAIKCLLGLIRPDSGAISIYGLDYLQTAARRAVGFLPEQPYFYDNLTVLESMRLYAALSGIKRRELTRHIEWTLEKVKLSERAGGRLRTLSKGLVQRLAMAQAIVARPRLLILDEPFSGLDPIGRKEFRELLCELKQAGTTLLMSSHILSDVEFLCDRVSIMSHGEIKGVFDLHDAPEFNCGAFELVLRRSGPAEKLAQQLQRASSTEERFVRLTFEDRACAEKALRAALETGAIIESFEFVHGGLEELFVKLVRYEEEKGR